MMMSSTRGFLKSGAASLVLGFALHSGAALAQDAASVAPNPPSAAPTAPDAAGSTIVVTGTRISSPNLKSVEPITSVGAADIKVAGVTSVEDFLNQLPQVFAEQTSSISNGATGTATVNLRGLGSQRTLVLIDGRRVMPGDPGGSAADLNLIPSSLIKRIDILTGGASTTYGADAVSGVVNFIMDRDFTGLRLEANDGFYAHNNGNTFVEGLVNAQQQAGNAGYVYPKGLTADGQQFDVTLSYGMKFADGAGHIMVYGGYRHQDALLQSRRNYSVCTIKNGYLNAGKLTCGGSATSAQGNALWWVPGTSTIGAFGHGVLNQGSENIYNYAPTNYYERPDDRYTAGAFTDYDVNPHLHLYGEFMFMADHSLAQIAPSGDFGNTLTINSANPLVTPQEASLLFTPDNQVIGYLGTYPVTNGFVNGGTAPSGLTPAAPGTYYFQLLKRNVEGGPRVDDLNHKQYRGVIGARGDFGKIWHYEAYYQYSRLQYNEAYFNDVSISRLTNALNVVAGPGGAPVCADPAAVAAGCAPYDVFSGNGVSQAAINYVTGTGRENAKQTEQVADINFSGDLGDYGIKAPWASSGAQVSLGGEWRQESTNFHPDYEFTHGDLSGQGGATLPVNGKLNVYEAIGEVDAPLYSNSNGDVLTFTGGARYSHYDYKGTLYDADYNVTGTPSPSFNTFTWKLGLTFQPIHDITLRGAIARAVRAPNLGEIFAPDHVQLDGSTDPCAGSAVVATQYGCLAQGLKVGQSTASNPAAQYNGLQGGNTELTPEKAITKSLGVVFQPHMIPGASLSVDYYDINIKNAIQSIGADAILAACDNATTATSTSPICSLINRNPAGSLWLTTGGYVTDITQNIGGVDDRGVDINLNVNRKIDNVGTLTAELIGTYLIRQQINNGVTPVYDCAGYYGVTCGTPSPKWRHHARLAWAFPNGVGVSGTWRYYGPVTLDYLNPSQSTQISAGSVVPLLGQRLGAQSYFDFAVSARITSGFTARLGIDNAFDKEPPLVSNGGAEVGSECAGTYCNGNTYPGVYDALGRRVYANVTVNF